MQQSHDHFGKPFVGGPLRRRGKEGEDIVVRDGECAQDILPRTYVVAGVRIVQEGGSRMEGQGEEYRQEQPLPDRGKKIPCLAIHRIRRER